MRLATSVTDFGGRALALDQGADSRAFIGREELLKMLATVPTPKAVFISACYSGAGAGKGAVLLGLKEAMEAARAAERCLDGPSLGGSFSIGVAVACSLRGGTGCGAQLGLSCFLYLLKSAAVEYCEALRKQILFLRQLLKLLNSLIRLILSLLTQPRFLCEVVLVEGPWFLYHGVRPPRLQGQAIAALSHAVLGRMCSRPALA
jgi:hypothetical protein